MSFSPAGGSPEAPKSEALTPPEAGSQKPEARSTV